MPQTRANVAGLTSVLLVVAGGCSTPQPDRSVPQAAAYRRLTASSDAPPGALCEVRVYCIALGDTVGRVAHKFGMSVEDLMRLNPELDPTRIQAGQQIRVSERRLE